MKFAKYALFLFLFNSFITNCNNAKCDVLLDGHKHQLCLELFFEILSSKLLEIRISKISRTQILSAACRHQILSNSHDARSTKTPCQGLYVLQISAELVQQFRRFWNFSWDCPFPVAKFSRQSNSLIYKKFNYRKTTEPFSTIFEPQIESVSGHMLVENRGDAM